MSFRPGQAQVHLQIAEAHTRNVLPCMATIETDEEQFTAIMMYYQSTMLPALIFVPRPANIHAKVKFKKFRPTANWQDMQL
jgi:hypothetical protein